MADIEVVFDCSTGTITTREITLQAQTEAEIKQQKITTLNQEYAQKIVSKEKYWVATDTSSLFTDEEIATLKVSIKADKLAIYRELKAKQEAIING